MIVPSSVPAPYPHPSCQRLWCQRLLPLCCPPCRGWRTRASALRLLDSSSAWADVTNLILSDQSTSSGRGVFVHAWSRNACSRSRGQQRARGAARFVGLRASYVACVRDGDRLRGSLVGVRGVGRVRLRVRPSGDRLAPRLVPPTVHSIGLCNASLQSVRAAQRPRSPDTGVVECERVFCW